MVRAGMPTARRCFKRAQPGGNEPRQSSLNLSSKSLRQQLDAKRRTALYRHLIEELYNDGFDVERLMPLHELQEPEEQADLDWTEFIDPDNPRPSTRDPHCRGPSTVSRTDASPTDEAKTGAHAADPQHAY